ncbi:MAG TPA: TetR/AcrR family transcriptional regulator [Acidimicrobiales bacterium]|jgi:AcrR family transcriptional regulator|nr:TetR/AcrR family transcriptional regulator [Acidimicrobiales bacterium]
MPRAEARNGTGHNANWKARHDAIVDTSARLFAAKGYHATGIVELCEANELGKGALYHYIGSKEALLVAIHDRVMDEVLQGAAQITDEGGAPPEQLRRLGRALLDTIQRYPDHVWVFLHDFPALTGERAKHFRQRRREYEATIEKVLQAGVDAGDFRALDPWLTSRAWLGMHNYTYLWWQRGQRPLVDDIADPFAEIFMRGIARRAE